MITSQNECPLRRSSSLKWLTEGLPFGSTRTLRSPPLPVRRSSGASTVIVPCGILPTSSVR
jgi:hypothetical protein